MSDQFMQEIQEEESALEALERKVKEASGGNVSIDAADDMIHANEEAQAIEVDALKDTVKAYQEQIEELRDICDRNSHLVQEISKMNVETTKGMQDVIKASKDLHSPSSHTLDEDDLARIETALGEKLVETETKLLESIQQSEQKIESLLQQSDDFSHKENVRVYRNVQAATEQLLEKQTTELKDKMDTLSSQKKSRITWVQIVTMIVVILGVVVEILNVFGVFDFIL